MPEDRDLPSQVGREWASEKETTVRWETSGTAQFIEGSLESPVSTARTWGAMSPKHSSIPSKPDFDPSIPYQGVQMWAGTIIARGSVSNTREARSGAAMPTDGLPSPPNLLPRAAREAFNRPTASNEET